MNYIGWHIKELKYTLIYTIISFTLTTISIYINIEKLISILIVKNNLEFLYTKITAAFIIYIKFSLLYGIITSLPFITIIIYIYIRPGMYKYEERRIKKYIIWNNMIIIPVIVYKLIPYIISYIIEYFSSFSGQEGKTYNMIFIQNIEDYYIWVLNTISMSVIISSVVLFIILIVDPIIRTREEKEKRNIKKERKYFKNRKYIYLLILIFIAQITPPDIMSLIIIYVPTIIIVESIIYKICINDIIWENKIYK